MDATTELIYPSLMHAPRTYNSQQFRLRIERMKLEELEQCIVALETSKEEHRDEKLRLCLRFRNTFLIQQPYFMTTKEHESDCRFLIDNRFIVDFFFLNFKQAEDVELFKNSVKDKVEDKSRIAIFIMNEKSIGDADIKQLAKTFKPISNIFLKITEQQYYHLATRIMIQEVLYKLFTDSPLFPCVDYNDIIWTLQHGAVFKFTRYPESTDKPCDSIAEIVKMLLIKMNLEKQDKLSFWILIENSFLKKRNYFPSPDTETDDYEFMVNDIMKLRENSYGDFCFMSNQEMDPEVRISIIATDDIIDYQSPLQVSGNYLA